MWQILEHRQVDKVLSSGVFPLKSSSVMRKWKDIAALSGPQGLKLIKGFQDEALSGDWKGFRSSRLNAQWRVIYAAESEILTVRVIRVTPHDYRSR